MDQAIHSEFQNVTRDVSEAWNLVLHKHLLVLGLVEHVGKTALAAVLAIEVGGHEDSSTTLFGGALAAQTVDLAVVVHLVVLEDGELDLPVLVLDLLGGGVVLLLPLLGTSPQPEDEVKSGLLLDVVVGQSPAILQLLASEDQPLLVRGDSLLVLDLGLDILDRVRGLHLKGDGLAREGLHEDLHGGADLPDFSCRSESSNKSLVVLDSLTFSIVSE